MRIAVDLDGVLYPWDRQVRWLLEHQFQLEPLPDPMYWNHIMDSVEPHQWSWLWDEGIKFGMFRDGGIYPGVNAAIQRLSEYGDIIIITNRPKGAWRDTLDWLTYHRIPAREVHIIDSFQKSQILCDVYIDDAPQVVDDVLKNTSVARIILWERLYNATTPEHRRIVRCSDWKSVEFVIREMNAA